MTKAAVAMGALCVVLTGTARAQAGCVPGAQIGCACPGGVQAVQVCNVTGTAFAPCQCPAATVPPPAPVPTVAPTEAPPAAAAPPVAPMPQPVLVGTSPQSPQPVYVVQKPPSRGKGIAETIVGASLIALSITFGIASVALYNDAFDCGGGGCSSVVRDGGALAGAIVLDSLGLAEIIVGPILLAAGIVDIHKANEAKRGRVALGRDLKLHF